MAGSDGTRVWLQHPKTGAIVVVVHHDTLLRCLRDGWTQTRDPNEVPQELPPLPTPPTDDDITERNRLARRAFADVSDVSDATAAASTAGKAKPIRKADERAAGRSV